MGIPALENLEKLIIGMAPGNCTHQDILDGICSLDFGRTFPKILAVRVFEISGPMRSRPPLLKFPEADGERETNRICHLRAEDTSRSGSILRLAVMFPNVTSFTVSSSAVSVFIDLWKVWPRLRTVDMTQTLHDLDVNLDELFCGISMEELKWLKEQAAAADDDDEDEFYKNLNIVPTTQGLYCMKGEFWNIY